MTKRKRVLICMASRILGGPGKGLVQFLRCGGLENASPVVVGFDANGKADTEFITRMEESGVEVQLLRQTRALDWSLIGQMRRIVENDDFDIYQSHGYKSHVLCLLLKLLRNKPWVAFAHGWTTENLKMHLYKLLDMILIRFADRVVAVSENTARRLGPMIGHKTVIITNAVDPAEYDLAATGDDVRERFGIGADEKVLCTVGRLSPEKGHAILLEAVRKKQEYLKNVRFLFVGDGQCREELEAFVQKNQLEELVIFAGYATDMTPYYATMDGLVLPSLSEGMPNVALEAMLFGKPVLGTRVGGVPEVVVHGESGYLVNDDDPHALGDGIVSMISDDNRMIEMGEAGRRIVAERFEPYKRAETIVDLYGSLS